MCVCIYTYIFAHAYIYDIRIFKCASAVYVDIHICILRICMCTSAHTRTFTSTRTRTQIQTHTHTHTNTHTHTYAHSHTHIQFYSDAMSSASQPIGRVDDAVDLPKISASAPPSPHPHKNTSPRKPEEVRKVRPIWEAAHSLSRDRTALTSRARLERGVEVEFKIPHGVTWSANMSTKPRMWCDFILDRPKRVWNWGKRLEKIHIDAEAAAGIDSSQSHLSTAQTLGGASDETVEPLKTVVGSLCTRRDVAFAHYNKKMAVQAERTLMRLFALSVVQKGGMGAKGVEVNRVEGALDQLQSGALCVQGPDDIESDVAQLTPPEGVIDMRAVSTILARLRLLNEHVSKTRALNVIADIKGDSANLSFAQFRAALKKIMTLGGKGMVEVLGLNSSEDDCGYAACEDAMEESIHARRELHVVQEREVLESIIQDMQAFHMAVPGNSGTASTYGLAAQAGAFVGEAKDEGHGFEVMRETPLLLDVRLELGSLRETIVRAGVEVGIVVKTALLALYVVK